MGVTRIGRCIYCQNKAVLHEELESCPKCSKERTPDFLRAVKRIRADPAFAQRCYEALSTQENVAELRKAFLNKFGTPWLSIVPNELSSDDNVDVPPDGTNPR